MRKTFSTSVNFGDECYLKSDPETKRTVTGFLVRENGLDMIGVMKGEEEQFVRPCDLIKIQKIIIKGFHV